MIETILNIIVIAVCLVMSLLAGCAMLISAAEKDSRYKEDEWKNY